jgi:hypothetical protein
MFSIFKTCQHYDILCKKDLAPDEPSICCICYDVKDCEGNDCVKLSQQQYYNKECLCDVSIHVDCLAKWCALRLSCPICRGWIEKRESFLNKLLHDYSCYMHQKLQRVLGYFLFCYYLSFIFITTRPKFTETVLNEIGEEKSIAVMENTTILKKHVSQEVYKFFFLIFLFYFFLTMLCFFIKYYIR